MAFTAVVVVVVVVVVDDDDDDVVKHQCNVDFFAQKQIETTLNLTFNSKIVCDSSIERIIILEEQY